MVNALEVRDAYRAQGGALLIRECHAGELTNKAFLPSVGYLGEELLLLDYVTLDSARPYTGCFVYLGEWMERSSE